MGMDRGKPCCRVCTCNCVLAHSFASQQTDILDALASPAISPVNALHVVTLLVLTKLAVEGGAWAESLSPQLRAGLRVSPAYASPRHFIRGMIKAEAMLVRLSCDDMPAEGRLFSPPPGGEPFDKSVVLNPGLLWEHASQPSRTQHVHSINTGYDSLPFVPEADLHKCTCMGCLMARHPDLKEENVYEHRLWRKFKRRKVRIPPLFSLARPNLPTLSHCAVVSGG